MQTMNTQRRKFSEAEKIKILETAELFGVTSVLREYRLSYSVFVHWKQKYRPTANTSRASVKVNMAEELKQLSETSSKEARWPSGLTK
jgi:putative transposase